MHRILVFIIAAAAAFVPAPVFAQTPNAATAPANANPLVRLAPADAQTLADALRRISAQANVAFVAEGKPFRPIHSAPPLLPVVAKWPPTGVPLADAVAQIADAYDYDAEPNGNVFLLRKRYTNPADLPDVTAEELRLALRDASRAASLLPAPTVPPNDENAANSPFMAAFFKTLTPWVRSEFARLPMKETILSPQGLFSNDHGSIAVSTLSDEQKNVLWQGVVSRHLQAATGDAASAYQALLAVEQKGTVFLEGRFSPETAPAQKPLVYKPQRKDAVFPHFAPDGVVRDAPPLLTDYTEGGVPNPFFEPREAAETQTLQSLCQTASGSSHFVVDPVLQEKSVLIIARRKPNVSYNPRPRFDCK